MPRHDPPPSSAQQRDLAWRRYRRLMGFMAIAAAGAVILALLYLWLSGVAFTIHMVIATVAGVGLSVLLGTALMGLVFLSNTSGHDRAAGGKEDKE
jgi:putative flippase GtrA